MKADAMLDKGNLDGAAVWRQIVAAVNEMQRAEPKPWIVPPLSLAWRHGLSAAHREDI